MWAEKCTVYILLKAPALSNFKPNLSVTVQGYENNIKDHLKVSTYFMTKYVLLSFKT